MNDNLQERLVHIDQTMANIEREFAECGRTQA
jgi:hypothetical protein